jgi:hypothetical protein
MFCCFCCSKSDNSDSDDNFNALHNNNNVSVSDEKIRGPSADSYSLSDEAMPSYDQIYQTYYR